MVGRSQTHERERTQRPCEEADEEAKNKRKRERATEGFVFLRTYEYALLFPFRSFSTKPDSAKHVGIFRWASAALFFSSRSPVRFPPPPLESVPLSVPFNNGPPLVRWDANE